MDKEYNLAELPVTDVAHVMKVIEEDRKTQEAIKEYRLRRKMYICKYYRKKKGLI